MTDALSTMTGFGSHFETEAIAGALPRGRNSPQQPAWSCAHAHETPQLALSCGQEWLLMHQIQEEAAS